jgi:hypothetical protein
MTPSGQPPEETAGAGTEGMNHIRSAEEYFFEYNTV